MAVNLVSLLSLVSLVAADHGATKPGIVCYGQFYTSSDCTGIGIRSEVANSAANLVTGFGRVASWQFYHDQPNADCIDVGGGHSHTIYVDTSASPMRLIGTSCVILRGVPVIGLSGRSIGFAVLVAFASGVISGTQKFDFRWSFSFFLRSSSR